MNSVVELDQELETPKQRRIHRITGSFVLSFGIMLGLFVIDFMRTH